MKNIVLKVPTAIFIALVFLPFFILIFQMFSDEEIMKAETYNILAIVGSITTTLWLFSIVDYFQSKTPNFPQLQLIYVLLTLEAIFVILNMFDLTNLGTIITTILSALHVAVYIMATIFITLLIRRVFYKRTPWFVIVEILIVIVGIITLTPEIKKHDMELQTSEVEEL